MGDIIARALAKKNSDQLAEHTNDYSHTLGFLNGLNQIRTRAILEVNGFYEVDDGAYGKYRVLSVSGTEVWTDVKDSSDNTLFQMSSAGEIRATGANKKIKIMPKDGSVSANLLGFKGDNSFNNSPLMKKVIDNTTILKFRFSEGTYLYDEYISAPRTLVLKGVGASRYSKTTFKLTSGSTSTDILQAVNSYIELEGILFQDGTKTKNGIKILYNSGTNKTAHVMKIKDCQFVGLRDNISSVKACGVTLENVRFEDGYRAIVLADASNVWHIKDCSFWYFKDASPGSCIINAQHCNDLTIDNCWAEHNEVPFVHISDFGEATVLTLKNSWIEHLETNSKPLITSDSNTTRRSSISIQNCQLLNQVDLIIDVHNLNRFDIDNTRIYSAASSYPIISLDDTNLATIGNIETHSTEFGSLNLTISQGEYKIIGGKNVIYKYDKNDIRVSYDSFNMRNDSSMKDSSVSPLTLFSGSATGVRDTTQGMFDSNSYKMSFTANTIGTFVDTLRSQITVSNGYTIFGSFYAWSDEPNVIQASLASVLSSTGYQSFLLGKTPRRCNFKIKITDTTTQGFNFYFFFRNIAINKGYNIWIDDIQYSAVPNDAAEYLTEIPYVMNNALSEGQYTQIRKGKNLSEHYLMGKLMTVRNAPPTQGTYSTGDVVENHAPTRIKNISRWNCITGNSSGGVWAAVGQGYGTTAERPTLTANDQGYFYFDSTIGKVICWNGSAWLT